MVSYNMGEISDYGFGTAYKWRSLPGGLQEARRTGKPIFLLIHKITCPSCQKLKEKFSRSIKLIDLSNYFVMINVENSSDILSYYKEYTPDGKYVPRILFFTYDGQLIHNAYNRHPDADPNHRYYYSSPAQIIDVMQQVIDNKSRNPLPESPTTKS
ncbi:thioredoxin domain-containing protein 12-like isoform X2 [Chelonus insularis]|uniref:thioredoxin domain-containing protein 12-like isoform X2 n=1 Tax=Chelonus insularis TaxID=460826 RepID=UPI00158B4420|nr:thioredoxin domain-containing protein 12-like isoform X2 [Chelonus insularis]